MGLQCTQYLTTMVDDILEASKVELNKITLKPKAFDIIALLEQIILPLAERASSQGLKFNSAFAGKLPADKVGFIDPIKLQQIVINLLSNAIKFTPKGRVTVSIELVCFDNTHKGELLITVSDTGIGIPNEKKLVIFELFEQVNNATNRQFEGTGLGLAITHAIVDKMQGLIEVSSVENEGTTFKVQLPIDIKDKSTLQDADWYELEVGDDDTQAIIQKCKILLVDDNNINRKVGDIILNMAGVTVVTAASGEEAIDRFEQEPFDLIFLDLHMPDIDGFDVAEAIRDAEQANKQTYTPIVALTADKREDILDICLSSGMDDILYKPYSKRQIMQKIRTWLDAKKATAKFY